ncbi:hypothetical protein ACS7SF_10075 [Ralstonia sp. 25C]|uniref:hypothetical protein n=1 Tax=Ralstonia sp. 25C TaxID=3447363 RepID=UPI003F7528E5
MKQFSQSGTTKDLLAFYERVEPILSKWLAKPAWTARETAALCAGYIPENRDSMVGDLQGETSSCSPIDPLEYLQSDPSLYRGYLRLLGNRAPAPPCDMVSRLRPMLSTAYIGSDNEGEAQWIEVRRRLSTESLNELRWLLIIGNAVGLHLPTLVPFGLLNELRASLNGQCVNPSAAARPVVTDIPPKTESVSQEEAKATRQGLRESQLPPMTAEQRGYYTTAEVAGLTRLLPDTLNKYAREGRLVDGFTPFKRQNGKPWQWRDTQQQAAYEAGVIAPYPHAGPNSRR